jgi:TolB-like protein/DNA-binding winged helix-turn-helix (wHTH) protein/tetratricopeptide (TPR) repeat protein
MKSISTQPKSYLLDDYLLETDSQLLSREGRRVNLPKRPFQVLLYLVEHRDQVVSRHDLLDIFWEGKDVYDDSLRKCLSTVRKALGDSSAAPRFIETRYAGGYRFIGPVTELRVTELPVTELNAQRATTVEIVRTRGVRVVLEEEICDDGDTAGRDQRGPSSAIAETASLVQLQTAAPPEPGWITRVLTRRSNVSQLLRMVMVVSLLALALGTAIFLGSRSRSAFGTAEPPLTSRSIAVLPLKNLTGNPNDEYLSDGLTESLINELARVNNLKVISRASSFTFKDKETDVREVGRRLGVANILEGSVARSGERIRISLRLVGTADGRVIWAGNSFDRSLSDIFAVQDEISCSVAESLRVILCGRESHKRYTDNVPAYQAYLKGRYYWNQRTGEGIKKSIEYYQEAIKLDPNYALAYAGVADSYVQGVWHVPFNSEEVVPRAKAAALKALTLDDSLAEAHTALAGVYSMEWNWAATGRELERAVELDPQYARAFHVQAFHLMIMRRYDEAVASIKRACELDPLNLVVNADAGEIFFTAKRTDEAFRQWQHALELDPNFAMTHDHLYRAYVVTGNEPAAIAEYLKLLELKSEPPQKIEAYRLAAAHGLRGVWQKELADLQAARARGAYAPSINLAWLHSQLGQKNQALTALEEVYRARNSTILLTASPMFDSLRSEPSFQDIIRRAGLS